MGRKRTIDRNQTMDAIEAVVRKHGLSGLSIDAVAREAGISKSSVVYDFQNKSQLLAAFIQSRLEEKRAQIAECLSQNCCGENAWLRAKLDQCSEAPSEEEMATAMVVSAGMGSDDECRKLMRGAFAEEIEKIGKESENPRMAMLAWLALNGILSLEYLGFHSFPPEERRRLIEDITWLMTATCPEKPQT